MAPSNRKVNQDFNPNYFTLPSPFWMFMITFGLSLLFVSTFAPNSIPTFLGPIGTLARFMGNNHPNICRIISLGALFAHVLEAVYAGKVCLSRKMTTSATIKWVVSTFMFGFSSLTLKLLPYKGDSKNS